MTYDIKQQIETGKDENQLLGAMKWNYVKLND